MLLRRFYGWPSIRQLIRHGTRSYSAQGNGRSPGHEALRILFCGSDAFSIYSLKAIHALHSRQPQKIGSIDVLCRPDKRKGRGLQSIHPVPIKAVAQELGLPLHQLDSFQGWKPLTASPNLIVTASFGLLVPASVLDSAQYGGINVHPSLLPDLRGAAPIQHAILNRFKRTGVSIQTMHPTKFDRGMVLAQEAVNIQDLGRNDEGYASTQYLIECLGPLAADLLIETLNQGLFADPRPCTAVYKTSDQHLQKAPKLTSEDRKIDWQTWTSEEIRIRYAALGQLWDTECYHTCTGDAAQQGTRMLFDGPWTIHHTDTIKTINEEGNIVLITDRENDTRKQRRIAFRTADNVLITPTSASIASKAKNTGLETLQRSLERRSSAAKI